VKRHSYAVEPAVTDATAIAATEKDKPDEKGKGGKGDAKKGKDKGDKKARGNYVISYIAYHVTLNFIISLILARTVVARKLTEYHHPSLQ